MNTAATRQLLVALSASQNGFPSRSELAERERFWWLLLLQFGSLSRASLAGRLIT